MTNFIGDWLAGDTKPGKIDEYIDKWHEGESELSLHTFLGMSWDEYAQWLKTPDALTTIIAARRKNQS